ncbi:MAG: trypsin-like peptidase domain-containing protein [Propionicimonas sp.]|uniref:S1C family serine protease n=1 Tax=Propionicimonas sp. TaxID=1955623 RepID=UPI002B205B24|nr:trypsin-like peptidase domain-containing protein [Propionicimonas sp.]MEA4943338.1 trypsin-like peptidase domain-containing protein [Propionicimonas sp.]
MAFPFARTAAALLAAPVLALSFALPASASAIAVRSRPPVGDWHLSPSTGQTTDQAATLASTAQSTGVVLIDTTIDYGIGAAAGTGLVLSSDGIVVTNHHVVEGSTQVEVTDPATDTNYTADVVGYDPLTDVAVLKLEDASNLATVTTDTSAIAEGDDVTAVGNSNGGGVLTASAGEVTDTSSDITVSADDGSTEHLTDLIEVDATVVPGDSGGALLDSDGEVVGMNVAADSSGTTGYAIGIQTVLTLADQILDGDASGTVTLGYGPALGLQLSAHGSELLVVGVVDGSAADQAGVTPGSVLTQFNGKQLSSYSALTTAMSKLSPGDTATIGWTDQTGATQTATVTLGRAPLA